MNSLDQTTKEDVEYFCNRLKYAADQLQTEIFNCDDYHLDDYKGVMEYFFNIKMELRKIREKLEIQA